MDLNIQSSVQSSIVRELSGSVESNSARFLNDIETNQVIHSRQTVLIQPNRFNTTPGAKHTFNIPRYGYLHRMELIVRARSGPAEINPLPTNNEQDKILDSPMNMANVLGSATLKCDSRTIEVLTPASILKNTLPYANSPCWKSLSDGMAGCSAANGTGTAWRGNYSSQQHQNDSSVWNENVNSTDKRFTFNSDYTIPLSFCFSKQLSTSLDTKYLKPITIEVDTTIDHQSVDSNEAVGPPGENFVTLKLFYHNLLPNVANNIRNTQHLLKMPLTLLSQNTVEFRYTKSTAALPAVYQPTFPERNEASTSSTDVTCNHFVTDIMVHFVPTNASGEDTPAYDNNASTHLINMYRNMNFRLNANGREIFNISKPELYSTASIGIASGKDSMNHILPDSTMYTHIPLTLFSGESFLNGGLNFKTLVNATFSVDIPEFGSTIATNGRTLHHSFLLANGDEQLIDENKLQVKPIVTFIYSTISRISSETGDWSVHHLH